GEDSHAATVFSVLCRPFAISTVSVVNVCYRGRMAARRYQGSFDHPLRAFLIGMSLLVLLFGGFVVGIEAGTNPRRVADIQTVTIDGQTITLAANTETVTTTILKDGKTKLVRVPGESFTRVVTVTEQGEVVLIGVVAPAKTLDGGRTVVPAVVTTLANPVTLPASTVTLPPETLTDIVTSTVTETETSTVTETVIEPAGSEPDSTSP
ncbi:MAG: hypothetical protein QOF68_1633, partial [Gaiellales bacterium]|nr:hypothetical protein [Gaiellales bacterium]